jgi:hypothetical protein
MNYAREGDLAFKPTALQDACEHEQTDPVPHEHDATTCRRCHLMFYPCPGCSEGGAAPTVRHALPLCRWPDQIKEKSGC